jgi:uncharacterized protein (TIGR03790 family)
VKHPAPAALLSLAAQFSVLGLFAPPLPAQSPANVLVVINDKSSLSRSIGEYYALRRAIPAKNLCHLRTAEEEEIQRRVYDREIAGPVSDCLRRNGLAEQILYLVTTAGVPLKIEGSPGLGGDLAAVDSELTLLYSDMHQGRPHTLNGMVPNPFFGKRDAKFAHPEFPIYLVTRLAAYDFEGVKAIIDRAMEATNRGKFVIDTKSAFDISGDDWLRNAAILLPQQRVVFDSSASVLYGQTDVIGYAGWGSNDTHRHRRFLGFQWLPGAIATEFVSSDARTFKKPPSDWNISDWGSPQLWFAGSPQTMTADFLLEGATGASGHVYEPYLTLTPRPQFVLPAYYQGRNLAESFYLGIPGLSWQNVVIGDPLCSLGAPSR